MEKENLIAARARERIRHFLAAKLGWTHLLSGPIRKDVLKLALRDVRGKLGSINPHAVVVLGSAWGAALDDLSPIESIPFREVFGLISPPDGHVPEIRIYRFGEKQVMVFCGRCHFYQTLGFTELAIPIYLAKELGAAHVILTNAAGGIREDLQPGTFMAITQQLNFVGDPLLGAPEGLFGESYFPDMTDIYDQASIHSLQSVARASGVEVLTGTYVAATGRSFESPMQIESYRTLGGDAVGMSTAPEAMLAFASGLKVLGLSCISNRAAGLAGKPMSYDDVHSALEQALPVIRRTTVGYLTAMCA